MHAMFRIVLDDSGKPHGIVAPDSTSGGWGKSAHPLLVDKYVGSDDQP